MRKKKEKGDDVPSTNTENSKLNVNEYLNVRLQTRVTNL